MAKYNKRGLVNAIIALLLMVFLIWLIRDSGYIVTRVEGFDDVVGTTESPQGVPKSQIPPGNEDLYILKSQVVPPVCPKCPDVASCPRSEPPPPCPACERCPEPSFDCKKIPNYSGGNGALPQPILGDFSAFS
jgi:hypothetical protein